MLGLESHIRTLSHLQPMRITGRVSALRGLTLMVQDLPMPVGSLVAVCRAGGGIPGNAGRVGSAGQGSRSEAADESVGEIVGFDGPNAIVMMLSGTSGIRSGDRVVGLHATQSIGVSSAMLGRVVNGLGQPIDGRGPIHGAWPRALDPEPMSPLSRRRINEPMHTGVRAIDLFTTLGRGQRMGVFAGPGVGKSTLLGAIAKGASADVSVVALIGERGREVRDFIEHNLGPEGMKRCVVVVATSDESPLLRVRAALAACSIAEHFRDDGKAVMLIMDSVTRFAHAQRQIGLSVGEPPATRGYTPSVFAGLARLLERAGAMAETGEGVSAGRNSSGVLRGSITGLYSVLVEGDDMTEPIADAARGILDGHIILSRNLAQRAHYPAIDVLDSVSRVADDVTDQAHIAARRQLVRMLATYRGVEDLVQIGAYARGSNPEADVAISYHPQIIDVLQQQLRAHDAGGFPAAKDRIVKLAIEIGSSLQKAAGAGARGVAATGRA
jgi:flagellum-specific ATP synthase